MVETSPNPNLNVEVPTYSLENFQDYLQTQGLSYNTILTYSVICKLFMQQEPTQDWLNKFLRQHNNTPTRSALKQYLTFIGLHKTLDIIKFRGRKKSRLQGFITREEVALLASSVPSYEKGLLILFMFQTGLRVSEALAVTRSSIDFVECKVRGIGKGNKEFEQCITPELAASLDSTYTLYSDDQRLWPFSRLALIHYLWRYSTPILGKRIHPHTLRHSIAMYLKKGGMNAEERAVYLNHDLSRMGVTVGIYSPPDREEVHAHWKKIMENNA